MKTLTQVLAEKDARFLNDEAERRRVHEQEKERLTKLVNAGMVDDVAPDGPAPTDTMEMVCGMCGATISGLVYGDPDFFEEHLRTCREQWDINRGARQR